MLYLATIYDKDSNDTWQRCISNNYFEARKFVKSHFSARLYLKRSGNLLIFFLPDGNLAAKIEEI
jgi:hypothetical protein